MPDGGGGRSRGWKWVEERLHLSSCTQGTAGATRSHYKRTDGNRSKDTFRPVKYSHRPPMPRVRRVSRSSLQWEGRRREDSTVVLGAWSDGTVGIFSSHICAGFEIFLERQLRQKWNRDGGLRAAKTPWQAQ